MNGIKKDIVVLGGGPGGYSAAFYAADRGRHVLLVEQEARLGGVCLLRGCIPSKALLNATRPIRELDESEKRGIRFNPPQVDLGKARAWKNGVVDRLSKGLAGLARQRGVEVLHGRGYFEDSRTLRVETEEGQKFVTFEKAIIAVGSKPAIPKAFDLGNPRVMSSTEALELAEIPHDFLIVGGGYIGMELGTVYATLGSRIVLVEALGSILAEVDADLVRPVAQYAAKAFKALRFNSKLLKMATSGKKIKAVIETEGRKTEETFDRVLVSVGRAPNCDDLGLENTKIVRDEKGFIKVDERQATSDPDLFAVGDVAGGALLAHKAAREARVAVDAITGEPNAFRDVVIPAVVFTDPELAWCGLTEAEAAKRNIPVRVAKFPWSASGRALSVDRPDGLTKLVVDPESERILGVGLVGHGAGELISEGVFAIEMGATARDLAESIHPHPTLSETLMECADLFYGTATHLAPRPPPRDEAAAPETERRS